jgi:hypothetical protein
MQMTPMSSCTQGFANGELVLLFFAAAFFEMSLPAIQ